uniref:radical SAM protein n=1 Tax=Desulfurococcus mucosus TaxID=2275 RepID=UPI001B80D389
MAAIAMLRVSTVIVFGPVPSRRLGMSLGVNNIPAKTCTYNCVYCQLGRTTALTVERRVFYDPWRIVGEVESRLREAEEKGVRVDYITFVPDGEPTLDSNLGREIEAVKGLGKPVAVLTNASLLWREDVRSELAEADYVSVKVDAVREELWRRVNRPHGSLSLKRVLEGVEAFSSEFNGVLVSETMLLDKVEYGGGLEEVAGFLKGLKHLS